MGTFRDEAYENLDEFSQMVEVVVGPQNEILANLPEKIDLNFDLIMKFKARRWAGGFELSKANILSRYLTIEGSSQNLSEIEKAFEFELSEDFEIDMDTRTMIGTLSLVKKVNQLDEREVLKFAVEQACRNIDRHRWPAKRLRDRAMTVLNTLDPGVGDEWAKTLDSKKNYVISNKIKDVLKDVIMDNKWRVREANIIHKLGTWINDYMREKPGNTGLVNLIKIKMMLDKDLPVYSMDEVKEVEANVLPF